MISVYVVIALASLLNDRNTDQGAAEIVGR
jgi:hypothetical protein